MACPALNLKWRARPFSPLQLRLLIGPGRGAITVQPEIAHAGLGDGLRPSAAAATPPGCASRRDRGSGVGCPASAGTPGPGGAGAGIMGRRAPRTSHWQLPPARGRAQTPLAGSLIPIRLFPDFKLPPGDGWQGATPIKCQPE